MTTVLITRFIALIKRHAFPGILLAWLLAVIPASAQGISGTYVSADHVSAEQIQIVQTLDGRITGRIETVTLNDRGDMQHDSMALDGAGDGQHLVLTARSTLLSLISSPSFSAVINDDVLDLSWQGGRRIFQRATVDQFEGAVRTLEVRASRIKSRLAFNDATGDLTSLTQALDQIEAYFPTLQQHLADASHQYQQLFPRMFNRRRTATALAMFADQSSSLSVEREELRLIREIDAVERGVLQHHNEMRTRFQQARSFSAAANAYCSERTNAVVPLCGTLAEQQVRLEQLASLTHAEFEAVGDIFREASTDTPPWQR